MKTQMKFQKWLCFALLILGALAAVLGLCYCSGLLAGIGTTTKSVTNSEGLAVFTTYTDYGLNFPEAVLYDDVQSFNDALFYLGIVLILLAVVLYITNTNKRRNYYVSNYVASGVVCAANIGISIYCLIQNGYFYSRALEIVNDPEVLAVYKAIADVDSNVELAYSESTVMFILAFILFAVIIVASLLLIFNLVWKINLMKGEKELLKKGFVKEVA